MIMEESSMLLKVAVFGLVQVLVYVILTKSSNVFNKDKLRRSWSLKPARSVSIRRLLAALQDMPSGGELSPSPQSPSPPQTTSQD